MSAFDELQKKQERGEKLTSLEFAVWWCSDTVAAKEAADELAKLQQKLKKAIEFLREVENDVHCDNDGRGCGASRKASELADELESK